MVNVLVLEISLLEVFVAIMLGLTRPCFFGHGKMIFASMVDLCLVGVEGNRKIFDALSCFAYC